MRNSPRSRKYIILEISQKRIFVDWYSFYSTFIHVIRRCKCLYDVLSINIDIKWKSRRSRILINLHCGFNFTTKQNRTNFTNYQVVWTILINRIYRQGLKVCICCSNLNSPTCQHIPDAIAGGNCLRNSYINLNVLFEVFVIYSRTCLGHIEGYSKCSYERISHCFYPVAVFIPLQGCQRVVVHRVNWNITLCQEKRVANFCDFQDKPTICYKFLIKDNIKYVRWDNSVFSDRGLWIQRNRIRRWKFRGICSWQRTLWKTKRMMKNHRKCRKISFNWLRYFKLCLKGWKLSRSVCW